MNQSERKARKVLKAGKLVTTGGLFSRLIISTGPEKFTKIFQNKITFGALEIAFPNGEVRHIKGTRAGPEAARITYPPVNDGDRSERGASSARTGRRLRRAPRRALDRACGVP